MHGFWTLPWGAAFVPSVPSPRSASGGGRQLAKRLHSESRFAIRSFLLHEHVADLGHEDVCVEILRVEAREGVAGVEFAERKRLADTSLCDVGLIAEHTQLVGRVLKTVLFHVCDRLALLLVGELISVHAGLACDSGAFRNGQGASRV